MHGSSREPLAERARTALSLTMLSCAAWTPNAAASVEARAPDAVEPALFEVIVTARKRPQILDDVPASNYAVMAPMLAATARRDLFDVAGQVAGMVFSRAPDGVVVRGSARLRASRAPR